MNFAYPEEPASSPTALSVLLFLAAGAFCLSPFGSPPIALGLGIALTFTVGAPWAAQNRRISAFLLKASVVLLGFGMNFADVARAGVTGLLFAAVTIGAAFAVGGWLGKRFGLAPRVTLLLSAGSAICGGSAIAAVGSAVEAEESEMTVSLGTVFLLNAVALYVFPVLGRTLHLSPEQFGTWAGIAIHDISSVVGAAAQGGSGALQTATAVKLSRALWIVPVTLVAARRFRPVTRDLFADTMASAPPRRATSAPLPWFIGGFALLSLLRAAFPPLAPLTPFVTHVATAGLTLTLFLIGTGLSRAALRVIGWRPLVCAALLWLFLSLAALGVVLLMRY